MRETTATTQLLTTAFLLSFSSPFIVSQSIATTSPECHIDGTVMANNGSTAEDSDWWYECMDGLWRPMGCVVEGKRYRVGQVLTMGEYFWGKCEVDENGLVRRNIHGCVDNKGLLRRPGERYLINDHFWAVCQGRQMAIPLDTGEETQVQDIEITIIGCNDGSKVPVQQNEEFLQIVDEAKGFGVAMQCKVSSKGDKTRIRPVACLMGSQKKRKEIVGLPDGCYEVVGHLVFYCTIKADSDQTGSHDEPGYTWQLHWDEMSQKVIEDLETGGFKHCKGDPDDGHRRAGKTVFGSGRKVRKFRRLEKLKN